MIFPNDTPFGNAFWPTFMAVVPVASLAHFRALLPLRDKRGIRHLDFTDVVKMENGT